MKYTFLWLAKEILSENNKAMSGQEIWNIAISSGKANLLDTKGKTPEATLSAHIYEDIKKNGENSDFIKTGRGIFTLRKHAEDEIFTAEKSPGTPEYSQSNNDDDKKNCELNNDTKYTFLQLAREVLSECNSSMSCDEIWNYALENGKAELLGSNGKTPATTLGARIGDDIKFKGEQSDFIITGHNPRKFSLRRKTDNDVIANNYDINSETLQNNNESVCDDKEKDYDERKLHPLLSLFVYNDSRFKCFTKTIYHEKCKKDLKGSDQWSYPDLVGVYYPFHNSYDEITVRFMETMKDNLCKVFSFEMKKEIRTKNLREYYFQAVSNSSWAHEGYLVAPNIDDTPEFRNDLSRLVNAFGIGIIKLNLSDIKESEVLYPARTKEHLDWATIDRLIKKSDEFKKFVERINTNMNAQEKDDEVLRASYDKILSYEQCEEYIKKLLFTSSI